VPPAEAFTTAPTAPAAPPLPSDGVRVVTRDNGRYVDLMPSPSSSYLLPDLASASLVRREARFGASAIRFIAGDVVELFDEIDDVHVLDALLSGMNVRTEGAGAVGVSFALDALASFLATGTLGHITLHMPTATARTVASAGAATLEELPVLATAHDVDAAVAEPVAPDAPVSAIATRIAELSGLSDDQLAELFKVQRETYCRWRLGTLSNPRVGNRRRLGLLLSLLEELAHRQINIKDWLLNAVITEGLTPYELLERGRISDVAFAAASLGETRVVARDPRIATGTQEEPLEFGDDDVWELEPSAEEDER
jgi:hypothetical protein